MMSQTDTLSMMESIWALCVLDNQSLPFITTDDL